MSAAVLLIGNAEAHTVGAKGVCAGASLPPAAAGETEGRLKIMADAKAEASKDIMEGAIIDADTPVGRVYRYRDAFGDEHAWRYTGVDGGELFFTDEDGNGCVIPADQWDRDIAPRVVEVMFAESEREDGADAVTSEEGESAEAAAGSDVTGDTSVDKSPGKTSAEKHLARIGLVRKDVLAASKIVADLKGKLKEANKRYNETIVGLLAVSGADPNQLPLFKGEGDEDVGADTGEVLQDHQDGEDADGKCSVDLTLLGVEDDESSTADADESWRDVPLDAVSSSKNPDEPQIKPKYLKALADNDPPITTIGQLSDWQAKKAGFWVKNVKGLGKAAADNIADALEVFWQRRRDDASALGDDI